MKRIVNLKLVHGDGVSTFYLFKLYFSK